MATGKIENELLELERQFWQAMKDRDAETAMRLSDDSCLVTGPQGVGVIDRDSLGRMVKDASYKLRDFSFSPDAKVRAIGDDVGIVAYGIHEELEVEGKPISLDAAESSTWVRRNGKWLCAQHSEALAGDPFGRDRAQQPRG